MKKTLLFLFFLLFCIKGFSQLDREHWFAPMVDRTGNPNQSQTLYFSTNRTTPFPVSIYNNNILLTTITLSKGNPQKFDVPRALIITTQQTDLFTPTTKGLYVKADFPFFANLRFSVYNHAEIITSKGLASKGTNFFTAMAPLSVSNDILNFMTSVLATEDNTHVSVSGYSPTVQFSNGTTGTTNPTLNFTLNKGQSYMIDGIGNLAGNGTAFIGAKIVADKPVTITNGNFNGQYAGFFPTSSDILMDQSVPITQLGSEFAIVKGNGSIGSNMEGALIVATENNTEVRVNNELIPIITLNAGQFFVIPDTKYIHQGNGHFNMLIKTTKKAYVYQILAGNSASSEATGGFNFIPALTCYLPKTIDELGLINENYIFSTNNPTGLLNIPTKLNLITETGANVLVNGNPPPVGTGPFPMTGTTNWVTYGIPNVSGNITVNSTKAITAGITAGSDAIGYGGFFAGFPTQPVIIKSGGDCIPGIVLTVDPIIYDTYQWYVNGNPIPGATNPSHTPTQSGLYTCNVGMGSCQPLVTAPYKVLNCTVNSTSTYNFCKPQAANQIISPSLSNSTQVVLASSVAITANPTSGTATVNPGTGQITYTPTLGINSGTDSFTYTFCGSDPVFPDCEIVVVNVSWQTLVTNNTTITACQTSPNGGGVFDLTSVNVVGTASTLPVSITYYPTLIDAQNENPAALITTPNNYTAAGGTIIYVVVKTTSGCKNIAQITLNLYPFANVVDFSGIFCDENFDGNVEVVLSSLTPQILNNSNYFTVRYYANLADANLGNTSTLPNNFSFTTNTTIYIRVDSPDGCPPVVKPVNLKVGERVTLNRNVTEQFVCDNDLDGTVSVNLQSFINLFTTDPAVTATFYTSLADAQNGQSVISNIVNVQGTQVYFIRFSRSGFCSQIADIKITVKSPKRSDVLKDVEICLGESVTLDAGPGFESYLWSTGATTQTITNVGVGTYWVELGFNGCVYRQAVEVKTYQPPVITAININNNEVTIIVTGGTPPYEYSLDGQSWQSSNVFTNLSRGNHIAYVRDANKCSIAKQPFIIINLINTITPNDDGMNDVIDYSGLQTMNNFEFRIFDRYGAEIFRGNAKNRFTWDGKLGGRPVSTATYWYFVKWKDFDGKTELTYTSWLLVKHRNDNYKYREGR